MSELSTWRLVHALSHWRLCGFHPNFLYSKRRRPRHAGGEGVREPRRLNGLRVGAIDNGHAVAENVARWLDGELGDFDARLVREPARLGPC